MVGDALNRIFSKRDADEEFQLYEEGQHSGPRSGGQGGGKRLIAAQKAEEGLGTRGGDFCVYTDQGVLASA